jgi:hypothetical protein
MGVNRPLTLREECRLRVFENKVLRRIFGPEELHDLNPSQTIIRVIKSRRLRWAGNVAHMGERISAYRVLVGKPERRRPLGKPSTDEMIILKWIFWRLDGRGHRLDRSCSD